RRGAAAILSPDGTGGLLDWNPVILGDVKTLLLRGNQTAIGGSFGSVSGSPHAYLALVSPSPGTIDVPLVRDIARLALGPVAPNPVRTVARVRFTLAPSPR